LTIVPEVKAISKQEIAERLAEARRRTLLLIEPLDDEQLNRVYSPILSPLAWDLGHIAVASCRFCAMPSCAPTSRTCANAASRCSTKSISTVTKTPC
jgi:hypothetical protein